MVTIISRFRVRNGLESEVRQAFLTRPRLVENETGFCGLEVVTDAADESTFLLITRWTSEAAFRNWHRSEAHHHSHGFIPQGLKLDPSFTQIVVGNRIEDPNGTSNFSDAIEGQTNAICRWLRSADAVLALVLNRDGTIRVRNRAADRIFPASPDGRTGTNILDFLTCSDADPLRDRLSDPEKSAGGPFLLNFMDGNNNQITVEADAIPCSGGVLLLGAIEQRHANRLQTELQILTNQLSILTRELGRKNKDLETANRTIEQLARTDGLTGLLNRRALDELLASEIARATRQRQPLALIIGDIDHFKSINDTYGHVIGDEVLCAVGKIFQDNLRAYDVAARFGGEEFVILLPGSEINESVAIAERLRRNIEVLHIVNGPDHNTISLGVANFVESDSAERLIARADAALYKAKNGGRNRVEINTAVEILL